MDGLVFLVFFFTPKVVISYTTPRNEFDDLFKLLIGDGAAAMDKWNHRMAVTGHGRIDGRCVSNRY